MTREHGLRMGELLVQAGLLNEQQVQAILTEQKGSGRPFGDLAERMYSINPDAVEQAWIEQYLSLGTEVDLDSQRIDVEVLRVLNRRQAWQFRMLPLRHEMGELVLATCRDKFARAVNFAWRRMNDPVFFLIAQRPQLESFLMTHYPWPAMEELEPAMAGPSRSF